MKRRLRTPEAAAYVGLSESAMEKFRPSGKGPRFIRLGRTIGYDIADLDAWLDERREASDDNKAAD